MSAYLDHAATSRIRPVAADVYCRALQDLGNPSSLHTAGRQARERLEQARDDVAAALGARSVEVIFTSGGSEADAMVLAGLDHSGLTVTTPIEHDAVLALARRHWGERLRLLPVGTDGVVQAEALQEMTEPVGLVSCMWANNETGLLQPAAALAQAAATLPQSATGAVVHSDAVQAAGRVPIDFAASGLDALSISGHKFGAPVGVGALVARTDVPLRDLRPGGGQERGIRSGTLNVPGALALAAALTEAITQMEETTARLDNYTALLRAAIADLPGVHLTEGEQLPGFVHAIIDGANAESLLLLADMQQVAAASSSACRAGVQELSHVMRAMGITDTPDPVAPLRLSLGWSTTRAEVEYAARVLPGIIQAARQASRR
ncbi:MAG: cysteine desulfurase family protein [Bowdeniella nasicola]|nr:cysteine desulfurase family protein [Bowdeniella nasicola]